MISSWQLQHLTRPEGFATHRQWWLALKLSRITARLQVEPNARAIGAVLCSSRHSAEYAADALRHAAFAAAA